MHQDHVLHKEEQEAGARGSREAAEAAPAVLRRQDSEGRAKPIPIEAHPAGRTGRDSKRRQHRRPTGIQCPNRADPERQEGRAIERDSNRRQRQLAVADLPLRLLRRPHERDTSENQARELHSAGRGTWSARGAAAR